MSRFSNSDEHTFSGGRPYILFVCTGNTCRSPMAYGIMKKLLAEMEIRNIEIRTAGVMTVPGLLPTPECRQLLLKEGIDITMHRSSPLTSELIRKAALVLGMSSFHVQTALRMAEDARGKTFLLKQYAGGEGVKSNDQVQDPMGCTLDVYKKVFREIRSACKRLLKSEFVLGRIGAQKQSALYAETSQSAAAMAAAAASMPIANAVIASTTGKKKPAAKEKIVRKGVKVMDRSAVALAPASSKSAARARTSKPMREARKA